MMDCQHIDELMMDFLYRELSGQRLEQFERHVAACARCASEVSGFQATRARLSDLRLADVEPPRGVSARLLHQAASAEHRFGVVAALGSRLRELLGSTLRGVALHPAMAAAASLVLVLGVSLLLTQAKLTSLTPLGARAGSSPEAAPPEASLPTAPPGALSGHAATEPAETAGGARAPAAALKLPAGQEAGINKEDTIAGRSQRTAETPIADELRAFEKSGSGRGAAGQAGGRGEGDDKDNGVAAKAAGPGARGTGGSVSAGEGLADGRLQDTLRGAQTAASGGAGRAATSESTSRYGSVAEPRSASNVMLPSTPAEALPAARPPTRPPRLAAGAPAAGMPAPVAASVGEESSVSRPSPRRSVAATPAAVLAEAQGEAEGVREVTERQRQGYWRDSAGAGAAKREAPAVGPSPPPPPAVPMPKEQGGEAGRVAADAPPAATHPLELATTPSPPAQVAPAAGPGSTLAGQQAAASVRSPSPEDAEGDEPGSLLHKAQRLRLRGECSSALPIYEDLLRRFPFHPRRGEAEHGRTYCQAQLAQGKQQRMDSLDHLMPRAPAPKAARAQQETRQARQTQARRSVGKAKASQVDAAEKVSPAAAPAGAH